MAQLVDKKDTLCDYITITMEEYKDLLITKGKYEELKNRVCTINWPSKESPTPPTPYEPYIRPDLSDPNVVHPTRTWGEIPITYCSKEEMNEIKKDLKGE